MGPAHAAADAAGRGVAGEGAPARNGGLISLIAHDLRVPLGPLALATSSLASDPALGMPAREFARIAHAQSGRVGRLMSAALAASGRIPSLRLSRVPIAGLLRSTAEAFASLGGSMSVRGDDGLVSADPNVLGECLLNLAELAGGGEMKTDVAVHRDDRLVVSFSCEDAGRCASAFTKTVPDDADSAFALAAVAVAGALDGLVEITDTEVVLALPPAEAE